MVIGWRGVAEILGLTPEGARSREKRDPKLEAILERDDGGHVYVTAPKLRAYMAKWKDKRRKAARRGR